MKNLQNGSAKKAMLIVVSLVILLGIAYYGVKMNPLFCFTFTEDLKFGDRPGQVGIPGLNGMQYFPVEVKALQTALEKSGFSIDPFEKTGGTVYMAQFFGPLTKSALVNFQEKYNLPRTGLVDPATMKQLNILYACPIGTKIATTTPL